MMSLSGRHKVSTKLRKVPVRSRARKAILWVHLWLSLLVGVFILAIALSGVSLVFRDETDRYIFGSELYRETPGTTATVEDAYSVVQEAYPDRQVEFIKLPEIVSGVYEARLAGEDEAFSHATVDPGTGELLGERGDTYKEEFNGLMFDMHVFLLSGKIGLTDETGIKVVGAVGIVLFVVLLTGIYLWWPGLMR
jgi:uncharacterized iron-regulated membrane protein